MRFQKVSPAQLPVLGPEVCVGMNGPFVTTCRAENPNKPPTCKYKPLANVNCSVLINLTRDAFSECLVGTLSL